MGGDYALERGRAWPPVGAVGGTNLYPPWAWVSWLSYVPEQYVFQLRSLVLLLRGWPAARDGLNRSSGTPVDATRVGPLGQQEGSRRGRGFFRP